MYSRVMITLPEMITWLSEAVATFPDKRTGKNTHYTLEDAALGAFSVFFTQSPSFLAHQREMQKTLGLNNASSLFGLIDIPTDNHIRDLLDEVPPERVFKVFDNIFNKLRDEGFIEQFRGGREDLLIALDGTEYFTSESINCDKCSEREYISGKITYSHSMITPAIVAPDSPLVIPLTPEYITPQDGDSKQDWEVKAAKRWIRRYGSKLSPLQVTILGDDLYAHQPICMELLSAGFNFILVCKEDSHKTLYEWINGITQEIRTERVTGVRKIKKETWIYRFVNNVPLRDQKGKNDKVLSVNFAEITIIDEEDKIKYHNAFITNHQITGENVEEIVGYGRGRWKIENENINTLKTKGYHLEHNFGHGKRYLSQLLAAFTLIAFLMHTVMDLTDLLYRTLRLRLGSRESFFNAIKQLTTFMYFRDWIHLFTFMIEGLKRRHLAPG